MSDTTQSIDLEAVAAGLRRVRGAVPEALFSPPVFPVVPSLSAVEALCDLVGAIEALRGALVRESESLANSVTVIAMNAHAADQARLDQASSTDTGTTSTTVPTVVPTSSPEPTTPVTDPGVTATGTTTTTTTTAVPTVTAPIDATADASTTMGPPAPPITVPNAGTAS